MYGVSAAGLVGQLGRVVSRRTRAARCGTLGLFAAVAVLWLAAGEEPPPARRPLRLATFNIEEFPKDDRQVEGAFSEIAALDVGVLAVQEIIDAEVFVEAARRRLGAHWKYVAADPSPRAARRWPLQTGVLYDSRSYSFRSAAIHDQTRAGGGGKPTLEVRLAPRDGSPVVQVFVLHFKAGSDGRPLRARQYEALAELLRDARRDGERPIVMGDFNATEEADRADLARLARRAGLVWATEALPCSAFWERDDGCPTSRLDHVLTWAAAERVEALGACARDGCERRDRCPLYRHEISDHCPVLVTVR